MKLIEYYAGYSFVILSLFEKTSTLPIRLYSDSIAMYCLDFRTRRCIWQNEACAELQNQP